ncbi:maleylpyruvate isomerase family mycothiol-dependent enzyme [Demetria terragena]|uniref:maleylpyruvate isomerase family mycothiol-dependent enzyme n=1 Tax=Demetria terragena TaxID=63959 RepID=UPI00037B1C11|nr:maleylpyruvate isomerase family mycothiol-dependent enzyme [Demetria terragena]
MTNAAPEDAFRLATDNRLLAVAMFEGLSATQWTTPSLCEGWTVREVAAHLLQPLEADLRLPSVLRTVVRYRGNLERYIDESTREIAARPPEDLVAQLRERASARVQPPFVGPGGQLADTCIHLRDAARPLGLDITPTLEAWRACLDFLVSPHGSRGFLPRGRLKGLRMVASDQDWSWGDGAELHGTSEALALGLSGRPVVMPELSGSGLSILAQRISA